MRTALALLLVGAAVALCQAPKGRPAALLASTTAVIPQVVDGGLNQSTLIFTNTDPVNSAEYYIEFFNDDGTAATFSFDGLGPVNTISGVLTAGQSAFYTTNSGAATVQQGWAYVNPFYTSSAVATLQIMDIKNPTTGQFSSEATVEGTLPYIYPNASYPFDNTNGNVSSMAICNTSPSAAETINVAIVDSSGNLIVTDSITMNSFNHTAFGLADHWPATAGVKGTVLFEPTTVSGVGDFAVMALRFAAVSNGFTVTALPLFHP